MYAIKKDGLFFNTGGMGIENANPTWGSLNNAWKCSDRGITEKVAEQYGGEVVDDDLENPQMWRVLHQPHHSRHTRRTIDELLD